MRQNGKIIIGIIIILLLVGIGVAYNQNFVSQAEKDVAIAENATGLNVTKIGNNTTNNNTTTNQVQKTTTEKSSKNLKVEDEEYVDYPYKNGSMNDAYTDDPGDNIKYIEGDVPEDTTWYFDEEGGGGGYIVTKSGERRYTPPNWQL